MSNSDFLVIIPQRLCSTLLLFCVDVATFPQGRSKVTNKMLSGRSDLLVHGYCKFRKAYLVCMLYPNGRLYTDIKCCFQFDTRCNLVSTSLCYFGSPFLKPVGPIWKYNLLHYNGSWIFVPLLCFSCGLECMTSTYNQFLRFIRDSVGELWFGVSVFGVAL